MDIDTRTQQIMSEHKETLARALATIEKADGREFGAIVAAAQEHIAGDGYAQLNVASDPVITDVPPVETKPETLDLHTLETLPPVDNEHGAEGEAGQAAQAPSEGGEGEPAAETPPTPTSEPGEQLT